MIGTRPELPTATVMPPCPFCGRGGSDARPTVVPRPHLFRQSPPVGVARCTACQTLFTAPCLADDALRAWYDALESLPTALAPRQMKASPLVKFWRNSEQTSPVAKWVRTGPVLDLGCGQGQLLAELAAQGIEAHGVEWDAAAVAAARSVGLSVEQADLRTFEPSSGRYQHIVLSHVLEHLSKPVEQLERVARGLKLGGSLLIAVPNAASALRFIFGRHWVGWDVPFHLTHFTASSMRAIARRAELRVVRLATPGSAEELGDRSTTRSVPTTACSCCASVTSRSRRSWGWYGLDQCSLWNSNTYSSATVCAEGWLHWMGYLDHEQDLPAEVGRDHRTPLVVRRGYTGHGP